MILLNKVKFCCRLPGHLTVNSVMVIDQDPGKFYQSPFGILL